jgi:alkylation response protein AidB-like acyl-CoA dehydrogenase
MVEGDEVKAVQSAANVAPRLMAAAAATDVDGAFPAEAMQWLHEAGLCVAPLPRSAGGQGLNDAPMRLALLCVLKHIGRGNLAVGRLYEGHVNALQLVHDFGSGEQRLAAARACAAGLWFGVWNTQADGGVKLLAGGDGQLRLAGSKTFASGAGHLQRPLVTAQLDDGRWQLVLVEADREPPVIDASFWQPLGMRASASFKAGFDGIAAPVSWLIGEPGDYYREPAFSAGAVRFAAVQLGGAEALLDETRRFLRTLGRTDDPHQRLRLGEMAMLVESGNLWFDGAARHVGDVPYAHLMRSAVEALCLRTMQLAERCVGARGLLRPQPFERLHRDLTHYLRQPAPDAALVNAGAHVLASAEPSHRLWGR